MLDSPRIQSIFYRAHKFCYRETLDEKGRNELDEQAIDTQKATAQANFEDQYMKAKQENMRKDQADVQDVATHANEFRDYANQNPEKR